MVFLSLRNDPITISGTAVPARRMARGRVFPVDNGYFVFRLQGVEKLSVGGKTLLCLSTEPRVPKKIFQQPLRIINIDNTSSKEISFRPPTISLF